MFYSLFYSFSKIKKLSKHVNFNDYLSRIFNEKMSLFHPNYIVLTHLADDLYLNKDGKVCMANNFDNFKQ